MTGSYSITCPVYGVPAAAPARRAGYDAARTTPDNRKHWANTDGKAAVSALDPETSRTLRNRARYEVLNNCFAAGLIRTLVADTVGTGARLQMLTADDRLNAAVEDLWRVWAAAADWPLTSRVLTGVRYVAGECFGTFRDSKRLDRLGLPVTLDVRLIEPDQVASPWGYSRPDRANPGDDGVECDADGDPESYLVLKAHPGDGRALAPPTGYDRVRAEDVIHWFQPDRPGALRAATPLAPALDVFAQLRRFTSATLTAAEVAAMLAGVMTSDASDTDALPQPPGAEPARSAFSEERWFDTVDLVRGTLLTLPPGAKALQFKPEQPTTNYGMFVSHKLREIGRAINVPYGKMAGDHSAYNYSSGRMDDAPYWHDREIERGALEAKVFDPVLYRWCEFARFAIPRLAAFQGHWWQLRHAWQYDARPVTDPAKDATADELNLANASDTLAAIAARDGTTEDDLIAARARTRDKFLAAGLPLPAWMTGTPAAARPQSADTPAGAPAHA